MKTLSLTFITSTTLLLTLNGCAAKNADGSYQTTYSYHPYNHYNKKSTHQNSKTVKKVQTKKILLNPFNHQITPSLTAHYHSNNPLSQKIERVAKSHLGKHYQWGATGPQTFDCSGFTGAVFKANGIQLPRQSKAQAKVGQLIQFQNLQKGDLIFFDSKKSSTVSHVGIYLGEGKFIHASSSKHGVIVSNINKNYYSKHFKWGRRLTENRHLARR